jgi:N-hydroxyarylamine O-acetyltransferase
MSSIGLNYLKRIGVTSDGFIPDLPHLQLAHKQHILTIPFENLDMHLGKAITLDFDAVYDKIVTHHRGGICFEQISLTHKALQDLGYNVTLHGGEVLTPNGWMVNDCHVLLLIHNLEDVPYLWDVGFPDTTLDLLSLSTLDIVINSTFKGKKLMLKYENFDVNDTKQLQHLVRYTTVPDGSDNLMPIWRVRLSEINWNMASVATGFQHICKDPTSPFIKSIIVSLPLPDMGRTTLSGLKMIITTGETGSKVSYPITVADIPGILKNDFHIELAIEIFERDAEGHLINPFGAEFLF